ncbi:hypothetical protein ACFOMH_04325 [Paracoccus mangrovi]|uniref:Uncharacterized protein n=1 Tax=Paracoccus mangrovi TaxID=1715645 RepID=A0ABV7QZM2_9RHOB
MCGSASIPLSPDLKALIDILPLDNLTFLVTANGKPSRQYETQRPAI